MGRTGKTALVTGASAGLGAEFCTLFAADGHDVVLLARRRGRLDDLAADLEKKHGVQAVVLAEDLADPAAPGRVANALTSRSIPIEFLVNNAGFGSIGAFVGIDLARELEMLEVNVRALVQLTRLFLPPMVARKSGRIMNIGSTAGFQPGPFMATYYASKAFVNSFTEALHHELQGTGVTATLGCPGATLTEFAHVAGNEKSRLFQLGAMGAPEVAAHAYREMMRGGVMAIPGLRNKFGVQSLRFTPRALVRRVAAALNRSHEPAALPVSP